MACRVSPVPYDSSVLSGVVGEESTGEPSQVDHL
jgi:hypothetical protein